LKPTISLDAKDIAIVNALERIGGKSSTKQLSEETGIPSRTVRYRISKMRESEVLSSPYPITHERKFGMGESFVTIKATRKGTRLLDKILDEAPAIYWFCPSYGTYDGYIAHIAYPVTSAGFVDTLMKAMIEEGLVSDYEKFEIVDFEFKAGDYTYMDDSLCWNLDWDSWYSKIEKAVKKKRSSFSLSLSDNPRIVDFDAKDFLLVKNMTFERNLTQKQLGEKLQLSEAQVNKRLARLEKARIIKGYRCFFRPRKENTETQLLVEFEEPVGALLSCLYELPFPMYVMLESKNRICFRVEMSASDLRHFQNGIDRLRPYVVSYSFQTKHPIGMAASPHPFLQFNTDTCTWDIDLAGSLAVIREVSKGS
jgi:DNA-binding Lrp family transcriptional regulator